MNQQIPKEKTEQLHSIMLYVIVLMYELETFALHWRIFYCPSFFISVKSYVIIIIFFLLFFLNRLHFSVYN